MIFHNISFDRSKISLKYIPNAGKEFENNDRDN